MGHCAILDVCSFGIEPTNVVGVGTIKDVACFNSIANGVDGPTNATPTCEHSRCWDARREHTWALLALSLKRIIIPHIRSFKTSRDA